MVYHNKLVTKNAERLHYMTIKRENSYKKHNILCQKQTITGIFWAVVYIIICTKNCKKLSKYP